MIKDKKSRTGAIAGIAAGLIFCLVFSIIVMSASLNCTITLNGTCTETVVLYIQNDTGGYSNAHVQNVSVGDIYNHTVCCDADSIGDTLTTSCEDSVFLKLSGLTNAHIEQPGGGGNYEVDACISAVTGIVNCTYPTGSCGSNQACLGSMASDGSSNATNAHFGGCNEYGTNICCGVGVPPTGITPLLNSTIPAHNYTSEDLWCSFVPLDDDEGQLYANISWIKDGVINSTNSSVSVTNGSQFIDILNADYTAKNEYWNCSVQICDSTSLCGSFVNSSALKIRNAPPSNVTLISPANGGTTFDRIPKLDWINATDIDGDALTYNFTMLCYPSCSADNRQKSGIAGSTNNSQGELNYFSDDGDYYNWSIASFDGEDYNNSLESKLNMQSQVTLSLLKDSVDFGLKNPGDSDNTSDNSPEPLALQNDGNCHVDVNLSAYNSLWSSAEMPSNYFRYATGNNTGENGSFVWETSTTEWTNIPLANITAISWLNWSNLTDSARIDIHIKAPLGEGEGQKNSLLQFTGWYVKIT